MDTPGISVREDVTVVARQEEIAVHAAVIVIVSVGKTVKTEAKHVIPIELIAVDVTDAVELAVLVMLAVLVTEAVELAVEVSETVELAVLVTEAVEVTLAVLEAIEVLETVDSKV